jgi:hypothetical protein
VAESVRHDKVGANPPDRAHGINFIDLAVRKCSPTNPNASEAARVSLCGLKQQAREFWNGAAGLAAIGNHILPETEAVSAFRCGSNFLTILPVPLA